MSSLANMKYAQAIRAFSEGADLAKHAGDLLRAQRFLNALGGSYLTVYQYRKALNVYEEARKLARQNRAAEVEAVIELNLTTLYTLLGDVDSAQREIGEAKRRLPASSRYWASLHARQARLALRTGDSSSVEREVKDGLDAADAAGNAETRADLCEDLGLLRMQRGDFDGAEEALLEAYRLRRLQRLRNIEPVLCALSRLALRQSQPERAVWLAKLAQASRSYSTSSAPPWLASYTLAQGLSAAGRDREALAAYQEALQLARTWRQEIVPSPEIELLANIGIHQITDAYACLAAELSQREGDRGLAWRAMLAVEQARDAAFRPRVDRGLAEDTDYQETVARWRAQQFWRFSKDGSAKHPANVDSLAIESKLRSMESQRRNASYAGPALEGRSGMERLRSALGPQDALLSFSVGEGHSWLWALTRDSFEQVTLPGRADLVPKLAAFGNSTRYETDRREMSGEAGPANVLCATLFGGLSGKARSRSRWLLSLDDALLEAPLSALRCKAGVEEHYLVEEHLVTPLVSAFTLLDKKQAGSQSEVLLGIGDPVYNLADDRWAPGRKSTSARAAAMELPRLPGTRDELERIARRWTGAGRKSRLLTGFDATPERFSQEIAARPSVIHLAVHLVQEESDYQGFVLMRSGSPGMSAVRARRPSEMFLMFSLRQDGKADGLTARSVGAYRLRGSLVVMSGCGTGLGTHQPGAGLAGFFKSWIAAGASGVVGTLWSIPDDASALFDVFYESIRTGKEPSAALREAQLALLSQGGWNSRPSFWSAWTTVGRH
jgi:CHAT domain-containing protein/tetratricopeptide (TPR) repeat protein